MNVLSYSLWKVMDGMSTRPALIPARQGTAKPARGCGECLGWKCMASGTEIGPNIQVYLPLSVQEMPDVCTVICCLGPCAMAYRMGVPLACCTGGWSSLCLILGHLHHPQSAHHSQPGALEHRSLRANRYGQPRSLEHTKP